MSRLLAVFLLAAAATASADVKITTKTDMGMGGAREGTVLIKGSRMRNEMNAGPITMVTIEQCDQKRTIQINDRNKTYMVVSDTGASGGGEEEAPAAAASSGSGKKGRIVVTMNAQELPDKKQFFGYNARHVKSTISTDMSQSSCSKEASGTFTMDGYYIDLAGIQGCNASERVVRQRQVQSGCTDDISLKTNGVAHLGYPVSQTTSIQTPQGTFNIKQEVTALSNATLDPALFEIPAGYREVKSYSELMGGGRFGAAAGMGGLSREQQEQIRQAQQQAEEAQRNASGEEGGEASSSATPAAKKAGALRIGVLKPTGESTGGVNLQGELVSQLRSLGADAIPLTSDPDDVDGIKQECAQKQCDYAMSTSVTEAKDTASTAKKIGGLLGRGRINLGQKEGSGSYEVADKVSVYDPAHPEKEHVSGDQTFKGDNAEAAFSGLAKDQARKVLLEIRKMRSE